MTSKDPVNLERLELIAGDDLELTEQLIELFLSDSRLRIDEIQEALGESNMKLLRQQAHALKGSSANMGATALYESASRLEDAAQTGQLEVIIPLIGIVSEDFDRTEAFFKKR